MVVRNFEMRGGKERRGTKILVCERGLRYFAPIGGVNPEQHMISCHNFWAPYILKCTGRAPDVDLFRLITPGGT